MTSSCTLFVFCFVIAAFWFCCEASNPYAKLLLNRPSRSKSTCKPNVGGLNLLKLSTKYYYFERDEKKPWSDANDFCRKHNMELLSIETKTEFRAIENYIYSILGTAYDGWFFWTSGSDEAKEGTWTWTASNNTAVDPSFFYYRIRNDTKNNCLATRRHSTQDLKLTDYPCAYSWRFICELQKPCP